MASISLLVGGIGIMKHPAGPGDRASARDRLAHGVGARRLHVLLQFLAEAVFLGLADAAGTRPALLPDSLRPRRLS